MKKVSKKNKDLSREYYYDALEAQTDDEMLELLDKALELNPANYEAKLVIVQQLKHPLLILAEIDEVIEGLKEEIKDLFVEENIGSFYGIWETRPYLRACATKVNALLEMEYLHEAVYHMEEIIRLNESDNLGYRDVLFIAYASFGMRDKHTELAQKYDFPELAHNFSNLLLYLVEGNTEAAKKEIAKVEKENKYFLKLLVGKLDDFEPSKAMEGYYQKGDISEAMMVDELAVSFISEENFEWLLENIK